MSDCGCGATATDTAAQRRVLRIALALNALMFLVEVGVGWAGRSTGLIADGFDMLADASAYAIALFAVGRGTGFKIGAARLSGILLLVLGIGVVVDVIRRLVSGEAPEGLWMIGTAALALVVNATVLRLLAGQRDGEVHLRATWLFTRADVVANIAVILAGLGVVLTGIRQIDLMVGAGIGHYVIREAIGILREASEAERHKP